MTAAQRRKRARVKPYSADDTFAAETDLPVKRRSSFEPEAAEEVKEDDKEAEKKGFSMWESISAQVKSVFPAEEVTRTVTGQRRRNPSQDRIPPSTKRHRVRR